MTITSKSTIVVSYTVKEKYAKGEVLEEVNKEEPLRFELSKEIFPSSFENQLIGLAEGDTFEFVLTEAEGYGAIDNAKVVAMPIEMFQENKGRLSDLVAVGNFIPLIDEQGKEVTAIVLEINEDHLLLDLNHPFAGIDIYVTGEVIEVS